jgi:hypothetical protein
MRERTILRCQAIFGFLAWQLRYPGFSREITTINRKGPSMKTINARNLAALTLPCFIASCGIVSEFGSGNLETRSFSAAGTHQVEVNHGCQATINYGNASRVVVTCDDNIMPYVAVEQNDDRLRVCLESPRLFAHVTFRAEITLDTLKGIEASGGSAVTVNGLATASGARVNLSGGSKAKGAFDCGTLTADLSGGSEMAISGNAGNARLVGSGGSKFNIRDLALDDVTVDLSGGSSADLNATGSISGALSGGSKLTYDGCAGNNNVRTSGGSSIYKR